MTEQTEEQRAANRERDADELERRADGLRDPARKAERENLIRAASRARRAAEDLRLGFPRA